MGISMRLRNCPLHGTQCKDQPPREYAAAHAGIPGGDFKERLTKAIRAEREGGREGGWDQWVVNSYERYARS